MRKFIEKRFLGAGVDREGATILSWFLSVIIYMVMGICFFNGWDSANDPIKCRVTSIGNTILSFPYALGCNIGKDRWNIQVNPSVDEIVK